MYKKDKSKKLKNKMAVLNNDPDKALMTSLLEDYYLICRKFCNLKVYIWQVC